jgi:hypothetical protein
MPEVLEQLDVAIAEARRLRCERDRLRYLLSEAANMAANAVSHAHKAGNYELADQYAKRRDEYRAAALGDMPETTGSCDMNIVRLRSALTEIAHYETNTWAGQTAANALASTSEHAAGREVDHAD